MNDSYIICAIEKSRNLVWFKIYCRFVCILVKLGYKTLEWCWMWSIGFHPKFSKMEYTVYNTVSINLMLALYCVYLSNQQYFHQLPVHL